MADNLDKSEKSAAPKRFKTSRLGIYIVVTGWLAFVVIVSQAFEWADFETAFLNFFSTEPKVIPFRAMALSIPLIFTIIGYMVFQREKFLGDVITTGRRLESKNISLETSYKKLYDRMREGEAGSAHTALLEESRLLARGVNAVISDLADYRVRHASGEDATMLAREDQLRMRAIVLLQEALARCQGPGKLDIASYLRMICRELMDAYGMGKVALDLNVQCRGLGILNVLPCGVIVSELVMNSLKHAFAETETPSIAISLTQATDGAAMLRVSDNGAGIPDDMDFASLHTFGLKMASRMARVMKGRISRLSMDQGTAFDISFSSSGMIPG